MPPQKTKIKSQSQPPRDLPCCTIAISAEGAAPQTFLALNVNGIRSAFRKGVRDVFARYAPDVICLSETKLGTNSVQEFLRTEGRGASPSDAVEIIPGYRHVFACASTRQGYASSAVFVREGIAVSALTTALGMALADEEGRFIHISFPNLELLHAYVPNSGRGSEGSYSAKNLPANIPNRLAYEQALLDYIVKLKGKDVVYCGDLNVAHQEKDLHNPKANTYCPGFTIQERTALTDLLFRANLVDTFRVLYPNKIKYSWFSNFGGSRANKQGWRIDYFLISKAMEARIIDSEIFDEHQSYSDHVPIMLRLAD